MTTRTLGTPKPTHLTLDTLPELFAHWRERTGPLGMTMEEAGGGDAGGGGGGDDAAAAAQAAADAAAASGAGGGGGGGEQESKKLDLTQADLDRIIKEKLGTEKAKFDQQLKDLQATAGKTEVEKLTAERDRYKEQAEGAPKTYGPRLAASEAKLAALTAKARPDRVAQIVKQADLGDAVGDDGEIDEAKVKAAVEKVLTDFPEWKAAPGKSGGDLGQGGDGQQKPTFTREQIRNMKPEEFAKNQDAINLALAEGRVSG